MKNAYYKDIHPEESDFCQPTDLLEIDDPFLLTEGSAAILYGTLCQKDAAKASYGTDRGFFCYLSSDLSEWAGPYLLCENPIDAEFFSAPKLVRVGDSVLLFGKYKSDNKSGIAIFRSDSPCGKFEFVSSFRLNVDFAPFVNPDSSVSLICAENGDLVKRDLSENLLRLSAPDLLCPKVKSVGAPAILPESKDSPVILVPTEKGLIQVSKSEKKGNNWECSKIKSNLSPQSCSFYTDPSGKNLLVCGMNHSFSLQSYKFKKNTLTLGKVVLPCKDTEIHAALTNDAALSADSEPEDSGKKKSGKGLNLRVNFSAVAAITIALVSAGIGILMGISAGKDGSENK